jgi:toxin CcdB
VAKYDVFRLPDGRMLLDVQGDHITGSGTRVVLPLHAPDVVPKMAARLHSVAEIDGVRLVIATHLIAAVPEAALKTCVARLDGQAEEITRALDTLLTDW